MVRISKLPPGIPGQGASIASWLCFYQTVAARELGSFRSAGETDHWVRSAALVKPPVGFSRKYKRDPAESTIYRVAVVSRFWDRMILPIFIAAECPGFRS
jgi:hypothetical protein